MKKDNHEERDYFEDIDTGEFKSNNRRVATGKSGKNYIYDGESWVELPEKESVAKKKKFVGGGGGSKPPRKKRKTLRTVLLVVLVVIVAFVGYFMSILGKMERTPLDKSSIAANPTIDKKVKNIALFGVDAKNGGGRSDAIIVLSIDKVHGKIKMTSILRDSYVYIEGYGNDKLTHAYVYGGPELAVRALNENFDLDITDFATVRFDQMASIVDAVKGVEINVKEEELEHLNKVIKDTAKELGEEPELLSSAGKQTLNGQQAVSYSRIRYVGNGDYARTERQREVLMALMNKALKSSPTSYPGMANKLLPHITTSLGTGEILSAGTIVLKSPKIETARIPSDSDLEEMGEAGGSYIDGVWYMTFDLELATKTLHDFIYNDIHPEKG